MGNAPTIVSYKIKRKEESIESVTFTLSDGSTFTDKNKGQGTYGGRYYFVLDDQSFDGYFHQRLKGAKCGYQAHFDRLAYIDGGQNGQWVITRYASELDWNSQLFATPESAIDFESKAYIDERMKDIELSKIALATQKFNLKDIL
jgi:hypothetical protein